MLRRRSREHRWAAIFADDLLRGCSELFAVFGGDELNLPISIPIDEDGTVLLQPEGPLEAPRVPASMKVTRSHPGNYGVVIERTDRGSMIIPGLGDRPLASLAFTVTRDGVEIGPGPLPVDEPIARALATALLITFGMKLRKGPEAQRAAGPEEGTAPPATS